MGARGHGRCPCEGFNSGLKAPTSTLSSSSATHQAHPGSYHAISSAPASTATFLIQNYLPLLPSSKSHPPSPSAAASKRGKPIPKRSLPTYPLAPSLCRDVTTSAPGQHFGEQDGKMPLAPPPPRLALHNSSLSLNPTAAPTPPPQRGIGTFSPPHPSRPAILCGRVGKGQAIKATGEAERRRERGGGRGLPRNGAAIQRPRGRGSGQPLPAGLLGWDHPFPHPPCDFFPSRH